MGIIERINVIIKSNINDLLDQVEDPVKMIKQHLIDMKVEYKKAEAILTEAVVDLKRFEREYREKTKLAAKYEEKAARYLEEGKEDLARVALRRKREAERLATTLKLHMEEQEEEVEKLRKALKALKARLEEAESKKNELITKYQTAMRKKKMKELFQKRKYEINTSAFDSFERMEEKIMDLEAEAEVMAELNEEFDESDEIEKELEKINKEDDLEIELEELKEKLKKGKASKKKKEEKQAKKKATKTKNKAKKK